MGKVVLGKLEINLVIEYDIDKDDINLVASDVKLNSKSIVEKKIEIEHKISETQFKFGILTLGARSDIGKLLPLATEIKIKVNGEYYTNKKISTHKSVRGRIDGLTDMYNCYPELKVGSTIKVEFDRSNKELIINTK